MGLWRAHRWEGDAWGRAFAQLLRGGMRGVIGIEKVIPALDKPTRGQQVVERGPCKCCMATNECLTSSAYMRFAAVVITCPGATATPMVSRRCASQSQHSRETSRETSIQLEWLEHQHSSQELLGQMHKHPRQYRPSKRIWRHSHISRA